MPQHSVDEIQVTLDDPHHFFRKQEKIVPHFVLEVAALDRLVDRNPLIEQALQAGLEIDLDLISQQLLSLAYVGKRVFDVPISGFRIGGLQIPPEVFVDELYHPVYGDSFSARDVKHFAGKLDCPVFACEQVRMHDIFDEGKVARLLPVSENDGRLGTPDHSDEFGNHGRILRIGVLPGSEDIEVAE